MTLTQTFVDVVDTAEDLTSRATTNILMYGLRDMRKPSLVRYCFE
jgi:hypothetical protein